MCWRPSAEHDLLGRPRGASGRSLFAWLRDLLRPQRPQDAEVVPFPAEAAMPADQETRRRGSKAA